MAETLKWTLDVEFLMACNCDWGCPCGFQAPPTYGKCEARPGLSHRRRPVWR
ncbi:MAG: DUF1326 domain-containing protein [Candidatus Marinimicrobia bacterium]|nr:DUF1326 domain-containing protein [Candidatus Neomarinimicrobiota bacterium]